MLTQDLLVKVDFLLPLLRQFTDSAYGIAVGGAHAKGVADARSDLDLYVFAGSVLPADIRKRMTVGFSPEIHEVISWGGEEPFEQAGTDFYLKELKIECWLRNSNSIDRIITECTQGIIRREIVTWTTTGFYNHVSLSDLRNMIPVEDPDGLLASWKERVLVYPPKLREAIIDQHLRAARFWPKNFHYQSAIHRADVIYCTGIIQQVVHNLIQVLFAANEVYFPGDKKLSEALQHLAHTPKGFTGRIQQLLFPSELVTVEALLNQHREVEHLLAEVESIVAEKQ